jgi:predicted DNA-binding ribbon-helix-helix protein
METLGSLMDKLSIETIRLQKTKLSEVPEEMIKNIQNKVENLKSEIDSYIVEAIRGNVPLEEPKFKFYKNEKPAGDKFNTISEAMARLVEANYTLWNMEDKRRDKQNFTDAERLACADEIATWNRIRNDSMDAINAKLTMMISKK